MALASPTRSATRGERLATGLTGLGLTLFADQQLQLLSFLDDLAKWNAVFNLTAIRDIDDMLVMHLLDSLSILPLIDRWVGDSSILDVGSGAGLPGIPIAIARPATRVTTVDAVAKKISFQQQTKATLRLANLTAIHARVEALTLPEVPALIVSRAFSALPDMIAAVASQVGPETTVLAMKGAEPRAELAAMPPGWRVLEVTELDVPFLGARRCAVVLRREGPASR